jgi:hypothetical protein
MGVWQWFGMVRVHVCLCMCVCFRVFVLFGAHLWHMIE